MMASLCKRVLSTVGQKFIMALTGLLLVGFLIAHLVGNLTLLIPGGSSFNTYAHKLESLGPFLFVIEAGLALLFFVHILTAIRTVLANRAARPHGYQVYKSKGGASHAGVAASYMGVWGILLLVFLGIHLWQFRIQKLFLNYKTQLDGHEVTDLYRLVKESFENPVWVGVYCGFFVILGLHLRHGFWSSFQSLGLMKPRWSGGLRCLSFLIAVVLSLAFMSIPIALYFGIPESLFGGVSQ